MTTYEEAGVHNDAKEEVSKILYNAARQTWSNRRGSIGEIISAFDDFSGVRAIDVSNLPRGSLMNMGFDGIGTKVKIAQAIGNHRTMAYDLFAMVCDDAVVRGAEPVLIGSILDTNSLKSASGEEFREQVKQLAEGYVAAAREANVAVVNGEVAELGNLVGGEGEFHYNWGASVVWFAKRERLFTGREIKAGDTLVGLAEEGFRSNGISLLRRVLEKNFGADWYFKEYNNLNKTLGELALTPSRIYSAVVSGMFGGYADEPQVEIHGVSHITGGGIPGKLGRMLKPSGLGARLDFPLSPSPFVSYVQEIGNVSDVEAYNVWNMGQGMIIATPNPKDVMELAYEGGIKSGIIGEVVEKKGIFIKSAGKQYPGKWLDFPVE